MEFRILGPLEVLGDDGPLKLGGPKQRAVLAHLILRANRVVPASLLIDELWGDEPPETARNTLQTYVYRLRKVLGDARIEAGSGGYLLHAEPDEIDAGRFEALLKHAKASIGTDPSAAAAELEEGLALWRGEALADLGDEPSLRGEIARLDELRLAAVEHRISAQLATGRHSTVVSELEALTARYPLRERLWANLMLALYRSGRQAEALSTYERARQVLASELGSDPSTELQRLHEQILNHDPGAAGADRTRRLTPTPRALGSDLAPGTEFAGYRIDRIIGRGGMGVVYLAEHAGSEAEGRTQAPRPAAGRRPAIPRTIRSRVATGRLDRSPERDPDLRGRRGRGPALHRDAVRGRARTYGPSCASRGRSTRSRRARIVGQVAARPRRRTRPGTRAPRRQARQRPDRATARYGGRHARVPHRFRAHQTLCERFGGHRDRSVRGNARLRGAGAVPWRGCGPTDRRVLARLLVLRVPGRTSPVPRRERCRPHVRAPDGGASIADRGASRPTEGHRRGGGDRDGEGTGSAVPERRRVRDPSLGSSRPPDRRTLGRPSRPPAPVASVEIAPATARYDRGRRSGRDHGPCCSSPPGRGRRTGTGELQAGDRDRRPDDRRTAGVDPDVEDQSARRGRLRRGEFLGPQPRTQLVRRDRSTRTDRS